MSGFADLANIDDERIRQLIAEVTPYRAIVTALSSNLVQFREVGATTGNTAYYPRIGTGETISVSDEILVIGRKNPVVIGEILR